MQVEHQTEYCEFILASAQQLMQDLLVQCRYPALIFADPPFNMGVSYTNSDDTKTEQQYLEFTELWMTSAANLLPGSGSLWVNVPDCWAAHVVLLAKQLGLKLENWCIWHYRFGVWQPNRFIHSKTHALWFSKGNPIVNVETAMVPSDRAIIYDDARCIGNAGTRMDLDVWGFDQFSGRVQGNNKERRPLHPNQLPEWYLNRVISLCSDAGHIVVDPFCGSGTTACVAQHLGRHCVTGDISKIYLQSAYERCLAGVAR
jgi:site-specific DNA-methyltransferase (adenine-specific)